jgi:hypothetical protein
MRNKETPAAGDGGRLKFDFGGKVRSPNNRGPLKRQRRDAFGARQVATARAFMARRRPPSVPTALPRIGGDR